MQDKITSRCDGTNVHKPEMILNKKYSLCTNPTKNKNFKEDSSAS